MKEIIKDKEVDNSVIELKDFVYNPDKIYILKQGSSYGVLMKNRNISKEEGPCRCNSTYIFKSLFQTETYWTGAIGETAKDVFTQMLLPGKPNQIYEFNRKEFIEWFKETF